jgi:hypothetical protein
VSGFEWWKQNREAGIMCRFSKCGLIYLYFDQACGFLALDVSIYCHRSIVYDFSYYFYSLKKVQNKKGR